MTTKFDYKIEDFKFLNMNKIAIFKENPRNDESMSIFQIENELTREEKIEIMDEMKEGVVSWLLGFINGWEKEKERLLKEQPVYSHATLKVNWLRENTPCGFINSHRFENAGSYRLFKNNFTDLSLECPLTGFEESMEYSGGDIVDQWFHDFCNELYLKEDEYFEKTNPQGIKLKEVRDKFLKYHIYFDENEINEIGSKGKKDVPEERLDKYIEAFSELEEKIKEISTRFNN